MCHSLGNDTYPRTFFSYTVVELIDEVVAFGP